MANAVTNDSQIFNCSPEITPRGRVYAKRKLEAQHIAKWQWKLLIVAYELRKRWRMFRGTWIFREQRPYEGPKVALEVLRRERKLLHENRCLPADWEQIRG